MQYTERLACLLGDPRGSDVMAYSEAWIALWEARGETQEAIKLANATLTKEINELRAAELEHRSKKWFLEDVGLIQDGLALQADRYLRIGDRIRAKEQLVLADQLAQEFGLELDADTRIILAELTDGGPGQDKGSGRA